MSMPPSHPPAVSLAGENDDFISLAPLWSLVRRYRRWLELSLFAAVIWGVGLVALAYLVFPKKIRTGVEFSLTFPDAALGIYPNRSPFRPEDLLEPGLLRRVYEENHLEALVDFETFRSGFSVGRGGSDLELLLRELRARLDDRKLTLADREKLEAEYATQLKTLPPTVYRLDFVQTGRSARLVPRDICTKIMADILQLWSDQAVNQRKVLASSARLPGAIDLPSPAGNPLVALMELTERTRVLAEGLGELTRLPGGYQVTGPGGFKLVDLQIRLESLQEVRIPQIRAALFGGVTDPTRAALIASAYRQQVRMREERSRLAEEKLRSALSTYRDYLASRPEAPVAPRGAGNPVTAAEGGAQLQISDTFLTKVMELGQANVEDEAYRGNLVEKIKEGRLEVANEGAALREAQEILAGLEKNRADADGKRGALTKPQPASAPMGQAADFVGALLLGCREFNALVADTDKLRTLVLENYLGPQTSLYRISEPALFQASSPLTPRNAGLFLGGFVFVCCGLTLLGCWIHDQSSKPQA